MMERRLCLQQFINISYVFVGNIYYYYLIYSNSLVKLIVIVKYFFARIVKK